LDITYSLDDVDAIAKKIIEAVDSKIIVLYGDMGVGKTTLVKSIANALGSKDAVSSPTFSIVNEYEISDGLLYHFDLYRIDNLEDAFNFGIEDYLYSEHWMVIEWPELIIPLLNDSYTSIYLSINTEKLRNITLKKHNK
jgi:tRNA threonylcarbamoyladenosine biosynthesis protein TsaE